MPAPKTKQRRAPRDGLDYFVEPEWYVEKLRDGLMLDRPILDPCCGSGTICKILGASGADIVDRGWPGTTVCDFRAFTGPLHHVVSNPPYGQAEAFVRHFLPLVTGKLAVLVRLDFLASQARYPLFTGHPPALVLVFSRRPSMPPGGLKVRPRGGMHDYCWIVWDALFIAGPAFTKTEWLAP